MAPAGSCNGQAAIGEGDACFKPTSWSHRQSCLCSSPPHLGMLSSPAWKGRDGGDHDAVTPAPIVMAGCWRLEVLYKVLHGSCAGCTLVLPNKIGPLVSLGCNPKHAYLGLNPLHGTGLPPKKALVRLQTWRRISSCWASSGSGNGGNTHAIVHMR